MKKQKKEEMEPGSEPVACTPFYFTNPGEANALFAGAFLKNLRRSAEKFHVNADARDLVVRITGGSREDQERFKSFLEELRKCAGSNGGMVEARDFDMVLSVSLSGSGSLLQEFYGKDNQDVLYGYGNRWGKLAVFCEKRNGTSKKKLWKQT